MTLIVEKGNEKASNVLITCLKALHKLAAGKRKRNLSEKIKKLWPSFPKLENHQTHCYLTNVKLK